MTQYAIVTDLNRCVGCLACSTACKAVNGVPIGSFWCKTLRIGPNAPIEGVNKADGPTSTCTSSPCSASTAPTPSAWRCAPPSASHKLADGTVQVDKSKCIGCQFCAMACPYGVRYLNEEERRGGEVHPVRADRLAQGELPQCVSQCGGLARFFGDLDKGIDSFEGAELGNERMRLGDWVEPYTEADVHMLPNAGNNPSFRYILRKFAWQG